jgi:hypothetical protein
MIRAAGTASVDRVLSSPAKNSPGPGSTADIVASAPIHFRQLRTLSLLCGHSRSYGLGCLETVQGPIWLEQAVFDRKGLSSPTLSLALDCH